MKNQLELDLSKRFKADNSLVGIPGIRVSVVKEAMADYPKLTGSEAGADFARGLFDTTDEREHFIVIMLDVRLKIKAYSVVSVGSMTASIVHPREVFRPAIVAGSCKIMLTHNHPSGEVNPSREDIKVTKLLTEAGKLLGIDVVDHIIIGSEGKYYSFSDHGKIA